MKTDPIKNVKPGRSSVKNFIRDGKTQRHKGFAAAECLNARLGKHRIWWDVRPSGDDAGVVSFVEADFLHKLTPEDVERTIAKSGIDAVIEKLEQMASLLGYGIEEWDRRMLEMGLTKEEVLETPATFATFEELCKRGGQVEKGAALRHRNRMWRAAQAHVPQAAYPSGEGTEALYNRIEPGHAGTVDDLVPYEKPMEVHDGKYYVFEGQLYRCTRDSGVALQHDPPELAGHYFEEVDNQNREL